MVTASRASSVFLMGLIVLNLRTNRVKIRRTRFKARQGRKLGGSVRKGEKGLLNNNSLSLD